MPPSAGPRSTLVTDPQAMDSESLLTDHLRPEADIGCGTARTTAVAFQLGNTTPAPHNVGNQTLRTLNVTTKLRAFVSSTMEDLGNERRAVANQLRTLGIDPVMAEVLSPDGRPSWGRIQREIEECHLFVLLLGERYGWVPETGFGAGQGKSVTHLELEDARKRGKLILAFMKKLSYGAKIDDRRDTLRKDVSDWETGVFRQEFEWADDLAQRVNEAITNLWTDALHKELVRRADRALQGPGTVPAPQGKGGLRPGASNRALLAGAGMSIAAGYPTAPLLMELLAKDLWGDHQSDIRLGAYAFSELASHYEHVRGRAALEKRVAAALDTPHTVRPTVAHSKAVTVFKNIVTTNYDELFERACLDQGIPYQVVHPHDPALEEGFSGVTIHKIVGSISNPSSLILTASDLQRTAMSSEFESVANLLCRCELVVIGHSLKDGNVQSILARREHTAKATYVSPYPSVADEIFLSRYGLEAVTATADDFMSEYAVSLGRA